MKKLALCWGVFLALLALPLLAVDESLTELRAKAEKGDAKSQSRLGLMYFTGQGVAKQTTEAVKWLRQAADLGDADAQVFLGRAYDTGQGITRDRTEALKWYRKSAELGNGLAQLFLGFAYGEGDGVTNDWTEAMKWYRKAAEQELAEAQFRLGSGYEYGMGVPKDYEEAVKWYRKGADQGEPKSQFNLGGMYRRGEGVQKDPAEARKWNRKAAEQGETLAQYGLGLMYATGDGVIKDEIEGLAWLNLSAVSGDENCIKMRDILEIQLGKQTTVIAQQRSKEILKQIESNKSSRMVPPTNSNGGKIPKSTGSGSIVSTAGHVLTAAHVVTGATSIAVVTAQGTKTATVERVDEANDLAVLKITDATYAALAVIPSRGVRLGQNVATIGFPNIGIQGFSPKLTRGEVSSVNGVGDDPRAWQISAPVQPGNSGGPLLDENGNLIGVVVSKLGLNAAAVTGSIPENVGYAVKSSYALILLEPYLNNNAPQPNSAIQKQSFEDMVSKAQQSVVLILVY